jgi:hypothetical protein
LAISLVLLAPGSVGAATKHAPVRMPNLIGHSRVQVYRMMRNDGLYFQTRGPGSANDHWAAITAQSPRPGVAIAWHAQATLTVTTQSPRGPRAVPRLTGLTKAGVYAAMRRAQLFFKTVGPGSTNGTWTVALSQSPAPGTRVRWHEEITVHVSTHRPVVAVKKRTPVKVTAVVINGSGFKIGVATWYNYVPGRCATWYLPKGTRITVTDLETRKSITCIITDREDQGSNRVVDLNETQFAQLAPLAQGVISVKVSW